MPKLKQAISQTLNLAQGTQLKLQGMGLAELNRQELVLKARQVAVEIARARTDKKITVDAVFVELLKQNINANKLGNAWGSIFRGKQWRFTGDWKKSERASNHARMIRVWRLVE